MNRFAWFMLPACIFAGQVDRAQPVEKPATQPAAFEITCKKDGDAIKVSGKDKQTIFDITSRSGIGGATVQRKGEHWPESLTLRVHLSGLESFAITVGDQILRASVQSHSGHMKRLSLCKGQEQGPALDKSSPYWMEIVTIDSTGKPAEGLPKEGGWFEMTVPKALLDDQQKTMVIGWIDFYRR